MTWEKDGELVDEEKTGGHICTRVEGNDYFLEINQSGPEDAGKYCVTARNSLGKQTATVEVSVGGDCDCIFLLYLLYCTSIGLFFRSKFLVTCPKFILGYSPKT